jgi:hypothetical protein
MQWLKASVQRRGISLLPFSWGEVEIGLHVGGPLVDAADQLRVNGT